MITDEKAERHTERQREIVKMFSRTSQRADFVFSEVSRTLTVHSQ